MTTPNTEALRLARINLRSRFQRLATRTTSMNVDQIEHFHDALDDVAKNLRKGSTK
jgi:hypothetical protein